MKKLILGLVVLASVGGTTSIAQAYGYSSHSSFGGGDNYWELEPAIMYYFYNLGSTNNPVNNTRTLGELGVGYHFNGLFYIGALYSYDNALAYGGTPTTGNTFNAYGLQGGVETDGVYLMFAYYASANGSVGYGQPGNINYNNGTGLQGTIGYMFNLGGAWNMGPELQYRTLHFTSANNQTNVDYTMTTLAPYIAFHIHLD